MTTKEEKYILDQFKTCYKSFPEGEIQKTEKPDFIIQTAKNRIGIELTEIFQDSHNGHSKYQQRSSDRSKFTEKLILELQKFVDFTFHISIHFSDFHHLKKAEEKQLIKKAFKASVNHLIQLKNKQGVLIEDFRKLPEEIDSIRMGRYDGLEESYDEKPDGGIVSDMTNAHIEPIIMKKEKKLKNYQECDEYWLLIKEGNYYAGTFSDIKVEYPISTSFCRIFLFRINKSEIIELK
ncbi:hypothetical protein SAMN04488008_1163 [Maribacter orientalis]|uniref:Uncharacterized protein n=1 Tax=Maribacter orientalis TaxID=228957 RepID=A0A1H7XFR1_9FLAO|nr:hypothetical protein [Maribacter orientalis]SEM31879.1 hypothetical protein SAMN04488008_1163 [Maribacter orientalis]